MRIFSDPGNRRVFLIAIGLAALGYVLAPLHTASALLSLPLAGSVSYVLCDLVSHAIAGRDFIFPSKWGLNTAEELRALRWSDHVLALVCGLLTVVGLFVFGEWVDCIRLEDVWRGEALGIAWCGPPAD
jgi:hypothetical protein